MFSSTDHLSISKQGPSEWQTATDAAYTQIFVCLPQPVFWHDSVYCGPCKDEDESGVSNKSSHAKKKMYPQSGVPMIAVTTAWQVTACCIRYNIPSHDTVYID